MRVLIGWSLQEANFGEIACFHRSEEIVRIVLMISRIALFADHPHRRGPSVQQICRRGVVLEGLVVRNVVYRRDLRNLRVSTAQAARSAIGVDFG